MNSVSVGKENCQRLYVAIQAARKGREILNDYFGKIGTR